MASRTSTLRALARAAQRQSLNVPQTRSIYLCSVSRGNNRLGLKQQTVPSYIQKRWDSSAQGPESWKVWSFQDLNKSLGSSGKAVIVDVREPYEYKDGHVPGAINIPVQTSPDALFLTPEEFEDRFGFDKPAQDADVVFYCKAGIRSKASAQLAEQAGYTNVNEYRGSFDDWLANGGKVERPQ